MTEIVGRITAIRQKTSKKDPTRFTFISEKGSLLGECDFFFPAEEGDTIMGFAKIELGRAVFIRPPFVQIASDKDSIVKGMIKALRGTGVGLFKVTAFFEAISRLAGSDDSVCEYLSKLAIEFDRDGKEVLEKFSKILEVKHIEKIMDWWHRKRHYRRLHLLGFNNGEIRQCTEMYYDLDEIYTKAISNPYCLPPISLAKCKDILERICLEPTPEQLYCGKVVREIYGRMTSGGSAGIKVEQLLGLFPEVGEYLPILMERYDIVFPHETACFKYVDRIEAGTAEFMNKLRIRKDGLYKPIDDPSFVSKTLSEEQKDAIKGALTQNISVITGGAGTGKTTIIRELIHNLELHEIPYVIVSFTGKAVARIREVTGKRTPATMHMMIAKPDLLPPFAHLIIDETSMVTTQLFYDFINKFCFLYRITLIGDVNQLPPISWGTLFEQTIKSQQIPVYILHHNFRLDKELIKGKDMILENAERILNPPVPFSFVEGDNFAMLEGGTGRVFDIIKLMYQGNVKSDDVVIISPYNEPLKELNETFQQIYNDGSASVIDQRGKVWMVKDRVMMTENNYEINVMNGEEGHVVEVGAVQIRVEFNGIVHDFSLEYPEDDEKPYLSVKDLSHSFAITIHKSQGSQKRFVLIYIPDSRANFNFLSKNLCYTAMTRAQQAIWCIGKTEDLQRGSLRIPPARHENLAIRLQSLE